MATTLSPASTASPAGNRLPSKPGRLLSLDIFRGVTIAAMILVNNPGNEDHAYWPLKHAEWNGWTPTDLVFPFFLFIVGVSMVFSIESRLQRGESRSHIMGHILGRGIILFALGVFLNGFPNRYHLATIRIEGVLQRIAICYVIAAVLLLWAKARTQILVALGCLVSYWILVRYVPVPGLGIPTHDFPLLDPDRNLVAWLDRKLLLGHLYEKTRDPEGVISTIPAIATAIAGVLTGTWLKSERTPGSKAKWMLLFGVIGLIAGEILNHWFPINKKLWTSSFVVFTAGFALVCLSVCYWLVEIRGWKGRWTIFPVVFGTNAIAAYVLAGVVAHILGSLKIFAPGHPLTLLVDSANGSLAYALTFDLVCWLVIWQLYRKKIFIKI